MSDKILEGILAAEEGATVYRKADGQELMVTGVACTYIDKYGSRKEEVLRFIELAAQAKRRLSQQDTHRPLAKKKSSEIATGEEEKV